MARPGRPNEGGILFVTVTPREGEKVELSSRVMADSGLFTSFTFDDRSRGMDKVTLEVANDDLRWWDDPAWVKGNLLTVVFGYPNRLGVPRTFKIRKVTGFSTLTVEAYGRSSDFHAERITRTFKRMRVDEVVAKVAQDNGYRSTVITQLGEKRDRLQQSRETDAEFLTRLADRYGWEWYIDADESFHFHPWDHDQTPQRSYVWRGQGGGGEVLGTPKVETSILNRPARFKVKAIDHLAKRVEDVDAGNDTVSRTALGEATEVLDTTDIRGGGRIDKRPAVALDLRAWHGQRELEDHAEGAYRLVQSTQVKMKIRVLGDPMLSAKRLLRLEQFGTLLSGNYRVVRAVHRIKGGYSIDLELRRDAVGRVATKKDQPKVDARVNREKAPEAPVAPPVSVAASPSRSAADRGMRFVPDVL